MILKTKLAQRLDFNRTLKLRFRQALQAQLEKAESEKSTMAAESGNKIKQALSLLDTARKVGFLIVRQIFIQMIILL